MAISAQYHFTGSLAPAFCPWLVFVMNGFILVNETVAEVGAGSHFTKTWKKFCHYLVNVLSVLRTRFSSYGEILRHLTQKAIFLNGKKDVVSRHLKNLAKKNNLTLADAKVFRDAFHVPGAPDPNIHENWASVSDSDN